MKGEVCRRHSRPPRSSCAGLPTRRGALLDRIPARPL